MPTYLDIENWERREHFHFFKNFEEPFWGLTVEIDMTKAYEKAKALKASFFHFYLHKSIKAANQIDNFKYRIEGDKVLINNVIHPSATIMRPNKTFGFSFIEYNEDFAIFAQNAEKEIAAVKASSQLFSTKDTPDTIHYSSLPWLHFSSFSHARHFPYKESVPKITFGKLTTKGDKKVMSYSVHVHHALVDGIHMSEHIEAFQKLLDED